MLPFNQLTPRGRERRLRRLAMDALRQYDLHVSRVSLLSQDTNLIYRLRTADGDSYILRVCVPNWRTDADRRAEVAWLLALDQDTDLGAPRPYPARNGEYVVIAAAEGVPAPRWCMVMSWIPGAQLARYLNETNLQRMGALFARLHRHGASFSPPSDFSPLRMDHFLARDEPRPLFAASSEEAFTPHTRQVFERALQRVETAFADLYAGAEPPRVIHNDLWHGNIKIDDGHLRPLDFEDTLWGYPVQDIAMAMLDLLEDTDPQAYPPLLAAFRRGYESGLPWPEQYPGQMDDFQVGRLFWIANFVAYAQRPHLAEHLDRLTPRLERYLETGFLTPRSQ